MSDEDHNEILTKLNSIIQNGGERKEALRNIENNVSTVWDKINNMPTFETVELKIQQNNDTIKANIKDEVWREQKREIELAIGKALKASEKEEKEEREKLEKELTDAIIKEISNNNKVWKILEKVIVIGATIIGVLNLIF